MKKFLLGLFTLLAFFFADAQDVYTEMSLIRQRMTGGFLNNPFGENTTAQQGFNNLYSNGRFADAATSEVVLTGRLTRMAKSYHDGNYLGMSKANYRDRMYSALQYWLDTRPAWKWTGSAMVQPRYLGAIALVFYDDMQQDMQSGSTSLRNRVIGLISDIVSFNHWAWLQGNSISENDINSSYDWNRGGNVGYRLWGLTAISAFSNDANEMNWIHNIVKRDFVIEKPSYGYHPVAQSPDGSRFQHNGGGAQNYIIGYGRDWWNNTIIYGENTVGTRWELNNTEMDVMADLLVDGTQWQFYKNQGMYSLAGRHNLIKGSSPENGQIAFSLNRLKTLKTNKDNGNLTRNQEIDRVINRMNANQSMDSTKYFWNSDMMIHSRNDYFIAVKMISNKTSGPESGNGNGKLNYHFGDGSTLIFKNGDEYENARVGWNYRAIPGITAEQKTGTLPLCDWGRDLNSSNGYAGGLTNGKEGLCVFKLNRNHSYHTTFAHKSYFFFDEGMGCLGSYVDQESGSGREIWTTLNQTEWKTNVTYSVNGATEQTINTGSTFNQNFNISSTSWFYQDGVGYIIYPQYSDQSLRVWAENRQGDWNDLDNRYSNGDNQTVPIFQLSINHGNNPNQGKYAYMVVPGKSLSEFRNKVNNLSIQPANNSTAYQVFKDEEAGISQVVFYQAGTVQVTNDLSITSDKVAVVMVKEQKNGQLTVSVNDPLQTQSRINIGITRELDPHGDVTYNNNVSTIRFDMPQNLLAGKAVHKDFVVKGAREYVIEENFESGDLGDWKAISTDGVGGGLNGGSNPDVKWQYRSDSYGKYALMYGDKQENEDWLISPSMDLSDNKRKFFSFRSASRWGTDNSNQLRLMVSQDYNGGGQKSDIEAAIWTDITDLATWAPTPGPNYDRHESGEINVSQFDGKQVYFAFRFTCDGSNNATRNYHIDDIELYKSDEDRTPPTANFQANMTVITAGSAVVFTNTSTAADSVRWHFEGGTPSSNTANNVEVNYATEGTFDVTLIAYSSDGTDTLKRTDYVTVNPVQSSDPIANFTSDKTQISAGEDVSFTSLAQNADSLFWVFQGASPSFSTETNPVINYPNNGTFQVTLVAIDKSSGKEDIMSKAEYIVVSSLELPLAAFNADKNNIKVNENIQFFNISQNADSVRWHFEGGSPSTSNLSNPIITYNNTGNFDVTLIAYNANGTDTSKINNFITVRQPSPPVAEFDSDTTFILASESISFFDRSSNVPTSWRWEFEGGTPATSDAKNPVVTYFDTGTFRVKLVVTNIDGSDSITKEDYITVDIIDGIADIIETKQLHIYPNPSSGWVTIDSPEDFSTSTVQIFSLDGAMIFEKFVNFNVEKSTNLNLTDYPKGTYLIRVLDREKVAVSKLTID